jgi:hypothetical protein
MWDEDPDYIVPFQGIEDVQSDKESCTKILLNGQLIIEKNGKKYNVLGGLIQ